MKEIENQELLYYRLSISSLSTWMAFSNAIGACKATLSNFFQGNFAMSGKNADKYWGKPEECIGALLYGGFKTRTKL